MTKSCHSNIFSAVLCFWWIILILNARVNTASTEEHPAILYTKEKEVHKLDLVTKADTLIATNLTHPYAVDYDYAKGLVAWSDLDDRFIYSAPLRSGEPITVLMDGDINSLGIAIDWIHDNIYWTDYRKKTIEVAQMNGKSRKTLFDNDIHDPRSIVLNPVEGWMFWLDSAGNVPRIERAGMDGTWRSVIVADGVKRSIGLAIDLGTRKLYWINWLTHIIYSVNYDGSNQHIILKESANLHYGQHVDVFQDTIYWCDSHNIYKANKYTGVNASELLVGKNGSNLRGVRVYDRSKQLQGPNRCFPANGGCSHLCLPAPWLSGESPNRTCACPEGIILSRDGATCTNDGDPRPSTSGETIISNQTGHSSQVPASPTTGLQHNSDQFLYSLSHIGENQPSPAQSKIRRLQLYHNLLQKTSTQRALTHAALAADVINRQNKIKEENLKRMAEIAEEDLKMRIEKQNWEREAHVKEQEFLKKKREFELLILEEKLKYMKRGKQ